MLDRVERHAHPRQPAERLRPLTGAQRHHLARDLALRGENARDPTALHSKADDGAVLDDPHTLLAGAFGERLGDVGRVGLAIGRQERSPDDVRGVHERPEIAGLAGREQVHLEPEAARGGRLAPDLDQAVGIAGNTQAAVPLPAGSLSGLSLQAIVELDRIFQQLGDVCIGAQLPDQPRGVPR